MTARAIVGLALVVALVGCSDDAGAPATSPSDAPDAAPADDLVTASDDCAPGTRAAIGTTSCVPVGTTTCAPGFAKDASGWGCAAIVPAAACTGATRPVLGETACAPIGDCGGTFPPANAVVVDPTLADGATDATHVRTLADALAAAKDGATIALADGEHVAPFAGVVNDVTIVGRCAEKTRLVPDGGGTGGLRVTASATVRGLTIAGMDTAFEVSGSAASLALEDAVIEASRGRALFVRSGAQATVKRVVVRGTVARSPGDQTIAVLGGTGGKIDLADSAVVDSYDAAIAAVDAATTRVTMTRTIVDGSTSSAIRAFEGAHVDIVESLVRRAGGIALLAYHRKTGYPEITLTRSLVAETIPVTETGNELATAINAAYGSIITVDDSTIADTKGIAIYSAQTAKITLTKSVVTRMRDNAVASGNGASATHAGELLLLDSAIVDSTALGMGAFEGAHVRLERSLIRAIVGTVREGVRIATGINATKASTVEMVDSSIVDPLEIGVAVVDEGTHVTLDRVLLAKTVQRSPATTGTASSRRTAEPSTSEDRSSTARTASRSSTRAGAERCRARSSGGTASARTSRKARRSSRWTQRPKRPAQASSSSPAT